MIDKRAIKNEQLYVKSEKEIEKLLKELNITELKTEKKKEIEEIG